MAGMDSVLSPLDVVLTTVSDGFVVLIDGESLTLHLFDGRHPVPTVRTGEIPCLLCGVEASRSMREICFAPGLEEIIRWLRMYRKNAANPAALCRPENMSVVRVMAT